MPWSKVLLLAHIIRQTSLCTMKEEWDKFLQSLMKHVIQSMPRCAGSYTVVHSGHILYWNVSLDHLPFAFFTMFCFRVNMYLSLKHHVSTLFEVLFAINPALYFSHSVFTYLPHFTWNRTCDSFKHGHLVTALRLCPPVYIIAGKPKFKNISHSIKKINNFQWINLQRIEDKFPNYVMIIILIKPILKNKETSNKQVNHYKSC